MKRTCLGCKQIDDTFEYCTLGFKVEAVVNPNIGITIDIKPKEQCPKPRTNAGLVRLLEQRSMNLQLEGGYNNGLRKTEM